MTLTQTDTCSLVVDARTSSYDWCVYEHHVVLNEGDPPTVIQVGAAKLTEVFHLSDGKRNSEWSAIFANGGKLLLRIVATTDDKREAHKHAQTLMRKYRPLCNLRGFDLKGQQNAILCLTNGVRYETQAAAAEALGLAQSQISRHLRGGPNHVGGFVFAYAPQVTAENSDG